MDTSKDFLAFCPISGGSSWGYGETPNEAVYNCIVSLKDWARYFELSEKTIIVEIFNVAEYTGFHADHLGVHGSFMDSTNATIYTKAPLEPVKFARFIIPKHTPKRLYSEMKAAEAALKAVWAETYEALDSREVAA
jgi:hypothetical protein